MLFTGLSVSTSLIDSFHFYPLQTRMEPIPLPAPVHYEVALRLLEQQTTFSLSHRPHEQALAHELIITLRKALSQQKRLEESCRQGGLAVEHRWSVNQVESTEVH